jgi:hypothetical protein
MWESSHRVLRIWRIVSGVPFVKRCAATLVWEAYGYEAWWTRATAVADRRPRLRWHCMSLSDTKRDGVGKRKLLSDAWMAF